MLEAEIKVLENMLTQISEQDWLRDLGVICTGEKKRRRFKNPERGSTEERVCKGDLDD